MALLIAGEPDVADLIVGNKHEELQRKFGTNLKAIEAGVDLRLITFSNAAKIVVARLHDPSKIGDDLSKRRRMIVEAVRSGKLTAGVEPGREFLSLFASAPCSPMIASSGSSTSGRR